MNTSPLATLRDDLQRMTPEFQAALPSHIPAERFQRVVMTAIQNTPLLLECDRRSLWNACMKAAQDGLLPDGRDGAIVVFRTKEGSLAQWMPMIQGIRKKAHNSGDISTWEAHCVYENDQFDFALGDEPHIHHVPHLGSDRGNVVAAYSIATFKNGEKSREVMGINEINEVRKSSRATLGPWDTFFGEMCRKTVARRHAKSLPLSSDLDEVLRRDDDLYDFSRKPEKPAAEKKPLSKQAMVRQFKSKDWSPTGEPETWDEPQEQNKLKAEPANPGKSMATPPGSHDVESAAAAYELAREARRKNAKREQWPAAWRDQHNLDAWLAGWDTEDEAIRNEGAA